MKFAGGRWTAIARQARERDGGSRRREGEADDDVSRAIGSCDCTWSLLTDHERVEKGGNCQII